MNTSVLCAEGKQSVASLATTYVYIYGYISHSLITPHRSSTPVKAPFIDQVVYKGMTVRLQTTVQQCMCHVNSCVRLEGSVWILVQQEAGNE